MLEPPANDLVHALKYEGWTELAGLMGGMLAALVTADLEAPPPTSGPARSGPAAPGRRARAIVVPMPTTAGRLRRRGYNQAELLATRVAEERGVALVRAIERTGEGRSQTTLSPTERRENVRGVFRGERSALPLVRAADVVLVDDVLTTGATASEAAGELSAMGAASVTLVAFARALPPGPRRAR